MIIVFVTIVDLIVLLLAFAFLLNVILGFTLFCMLCIGQSHAYAR